LGEETEDLAIIVYVNRKLGLQRLPLLNRIPTTVSIPDAHASGGVLEFITDVQEARFGALPLRPSACGPPAAASASVIVTRPRARWGAWCVTARPATW
jgi:hypothetical protein